MKKSLSTLVISGLSGGAGKTLCTIGLIAELKKRTFKIAPFKKGPDFIDMAWLSRAAKRQCRNLDTFLMGEIKTEHSFFKWSYDTDIAIIEGNRGLFDGFDEKGSFSTANITKLLSSKVVLIVNCTKMTNSVAAIITGCQKFDPQLAISGVILNRVAGIRHEKILRDSISYHTNVPVVGIIPKLKQELLFERHLGLLPPEEHDEVDIIIEKTRTIGRNYLDIDQIVKIAETDPNPRRKQEKILELEEKKVAIPQCATPRKIGMLRDRAFNFYYPENIESLKKYTDHIVEINAMSDTTLPDIDFLYIGGGFPETQAEFLEKNITFMKSLKLAVENGLKVYAECGGLVYLGTSLTYHNKRYSMTGIFPVHFDFSKKPRGHGYTLVKIVKKNPFYKVGTLLKGHEFHYTYPINTEQIDFVGEINRGYGFNGKQDCIVYKNVFATYTHIHAESMNSWGECLIFDE